MVRRSRWQAHRWTQVPKDSQAWPAARESPELVMNASIRPPVFYLFGGNSGGQRWNDLWKFDLEAGRSKHGASAG